MKGNKIFLSLFIGITLLFDPFFVVLAAVQNTGHLADSGAGETETIKVISPEDYIPQDKFWPIIKREVQSYIDPETGAKIEHETIWKQEPKGQSSTIPENQKCSELLNTNSELGITATCTFQGNVSRNDKVKISKNATYLQAILTSYSKKWCQSTGCIYGTYYDMYQMDASWYRTSTKWTAKEAKYEWGCPINSCQTCGSDYTLGKRNGDIVSVVAWYSNTKSMVYQITYSAFPEMTARLEGAYPFSKTTSKAYHDNVYIGSLAPTVTWTE